jgi:hypothetical protein
VFTHICTDLNNSITFGTAINGRGDMEMCDEEKWTYAQQESNAWRNNSITVIIIPIGPCYIYFERHCGKKQNLALKQIMARIYV